MGVYEANKNVKLVFKAKKSKVLWLYLLCMGQFFCLFQKYVNIVCIDIHFDIMWGT